jgi:hypothetical protein
MSGHQSLRLRLDRGEVVLAADACYFCQTLRERRLPRNMYDREEHWAQICTSIVSGVKSRRLDFLHHRRE